MDERGEYLGTTNPINCREPAQDGLERFSTERHRFLLVCQSYPPVIGGSELEAQRICEALIHRGHDVTVVCAGGEPMPDVKDWVDPKNVPVRIYARHSEGAIKNLVFAFCVASMLFAERQKYQFVYFLMPGLHVALGLCAAQLIGKPTLMKISGSGEVNRMGRSLIGRFELWMLRRWASRVMILNEGMRGEALSAGLANDQLLWMPNPVDTEEFSPATAEEKERLRSRLGVPEESKIVLYCGRLAVEKALPSLLQGFATALTEVSDALLVLVGDGSMRDSLEKQAVGLGLENRNIRFAGRVDPGEVSAWLKIADVFTLVSSLEGFPCSLIEAMSSGLPSIASNIEANQQLVADGKEGFLVPVGDCSAIARRIVALLNDAVLRTKMGR
ncbi:MAG TPA: glycosyltransferase family 4 protein, partial [Candidatus Acidoferrales bacterium]|nr:glycosyltransferase family 4 protein [Candidatus Acidoferrales bacterium]